MKVIISDVDETLVDHTSDNSEDIKLLEQILKENKIPFTFATGRPYRHMVELIDQFIPSLPVILNNGATIFFEGRVVFNRYLNLEHLKVMIENLFNLGFLAIYADESDEYQDTSYLTIYGKKPLSDYRISKSLKKHINDGQHLNRLLFRDTERKYATLIKEIEESSLKHHYSIVTYGDNQIEFSPKFISKATGLQYIKNLYDPNAEYIAIGNAPNDIQMIECADIGVAVANSSRRVIETADIVTSNSYAKGIIEYVSKHYL